MTIAAETALVAAAVGAEVAVAGDCIVRGVEVLALLYVSSPFASLCSVAGFVKAAGRAAEFFGGYY